MKIDLSEVLSEQSALKHSLEAGKQQLANAQAKLNLVVQSEDLKGKVKEAINQKVSNYQLPLLENYLTILGMIDTAYERLIQQFKDTVSETKNNAIIDTDYLLTLAQRMRDPMTHISEVSTATAKIYAEISDLLPLENPSKEAIFSEYANCTKSLEDTVKNMETFNSYALNSDISDLLKTQGTQISNLSFYAPQPYTGVSAQLFYRNTDFKKNVREYHLASNPRLKMTRLQNRLAITIAKSAKQGYIYQKPVVYKASDAKTEAQLRFILSQMSKSDIEAEFSDVIRSYKAMQAMGKGYTIKNAAEFRRNQLILARYQEVKDDPDTLTREQLAKLDPHYKAKIDKLSHKELEKRYPFLQNLRYAEVDPLYILNHSETEVANREYLVQRYFQLDKQQPISTRDPAFMTKYTDYIKKTGRNPFTGEAVNEGTMFMAKNYAWVKGSSEILASIAGGVADYSELIAGSRIFGEKMNLTSPKTNFSSTSTKTAKPMESLNKKTVQSSFVDGMSPEDARRYTQWDKYAEAGISPQDRVKLMDWEYAPDSVLYKKYKNVYDNPLYYNQKNGNINWPKNSGFADKPNKIVLQPGTKIDRYGSDYGTFTSPEGIPYGQRAVVPGTNKKPYSVFEIKEPLEVEAGTVAPWFDEPGGGIQYLLPDTVDELYN